MLDENDLAKIKEMIISVVGGLTTQDIPNDIVVPNTGVRRVKRADKKEVIKGKTKDKQARVEPFVPIKNRPNNFLNSQEKNMFKNDTLIDKKLSGGLTPTPRRPEASMVEVECKECGSIDVVNEAYLHFDEDTNEVNYTCNNCVRNK